MLKPFLSIGEYQRANQLEKGLHGTPSIPLATTSEGLQGFSKGSCFSKHFPLQQPGPELAAPQLAAIKQDRPQALAAHCTYFANFLKPMALFLVGVPLTPFQMWVFQGSG